MQVFEQIQTIPEHYVYYAVFHDFLCFVFNICNFPRFAYRRQIDITTYHIIKIKADTSLCLFGDDLYPTKYVISVLFVCFFNEFLVTIETKYKSTVYY